MESLRANDPTHLGGHRLLARLGAGGMGQVYLGLTRGGRHVAVKVIRDDFTDAQALARFRREVATVQAVRSPHTAALVGSGLDEPPYWLATEYVPGPTLAQAVAAYGPFSTRAGLRLLAALAEAVADVHRRGVEHRDLKPANVILAADGPRLIDFGIARGDEHSTITRTGAMAGTPGYLAPEVVVRGRTGHAADVFALAGTVAFAVTGRAPFGGGDAHAVMYRSVHQEMDLDGVDPQLAALLRAASVKDPDLRLSAAEILDRCQVSGSLVDEPDYQGLHGLTRRPPADVEEARRTGLLPVTGAGTVRSRRTVVAVAAAVTAVVIGGAFGLRTILNEPSTGTGGGGGPAAGNSGGAGVRGPAAASGNPDPSPGVSPKTVNNKIVGAPDDLFWSPKTRTCDPAVPSTETVPMRLTVTPQKNPTGPSVRIEYGVEGGGVPDPPYYLASAVYPTYPATGWDESQLSRPFALPEKGWRTTLEYPRDYRSVHHETWPVHRGTWTVLTYHVHSDGAAVLIDCTGFEAT